MRTPLVRKRVLNFIWIFIDICAFTAFICWHEQLWLDEIYCLSILSAIFFMLLLCTLIYDRKHGFLSGNRGTTYSKVAMGMTLTGLLVVTGIWLPHFTAPVLLAAVLMEGMTTVELSFCSCMFYEAVLCIGLGLSMYEFVLYFLLTAFGCMIASSVEKENFSFWHALFLLCVNTLLPGIMFYIAYQEVRMNLFMYGAISGFVISYFVILFFRRIYKFKISDRDAQIRKILREDYHLVSELKNFSIQEYDHAKRVSKLAADCAEFVGADTLVCQAAGFYYRIGILEGDNIGTSGEKIALSECFPEEVVSIIKEYNGEERLPSSVESAIVHIVENIVLKLEAFKSGELMHSDWNQDMLIYQTTNDFSNTGIYDKSGLSMNTYLHLREYLVKKELLI